MVISITHGIGLGGAIDFERGSMLLAFEVFKAKGRFLEISKTRKRKRKGERKRSILEQGGNPSVHTKHALKGL